MSFVYAINDGIFMVLSDTKIGINENLDGLWKSEGSKRLIGQMGMIKSIIVSPHIVISYAGNNIGKAACLLKDVKSKNYDLEAIIKTAFDIHNSVHINDIEFIIAYYKDKNRNELISIKDGNIVRNCKKAWIGSFVAYREFKHLEQEIPKNRNEDLTVTVIDDSENMHQELIDNKMGYIYGLEKAFCDVVESGIDSSVGGIVVRIGISMEKNSLSIWVAEALPLATGLKRLNPIKI